MSKRHAEPEIDAFLAIGGYADIEEWMEDSDYHQDADGDWMDEFDNPIWPTDAIAGAMDACHDDDQEELDALLVAFQATGGRGVELADLIDLYRTRLGLS